jgi:sigma-B regulation protein RsbU (phosphoserine phosphatase)
LTKEGYREEGLPELWSIVQRLNRCMYEISPDNAYATLFYAHLDPLHRRLHYVNAGHEPALLIRGESDRVIHLESTGTVLGMFCQAAYKERSVALESGDTLVIFTDGISEAADDAGRELRDAGLLEIIKDLVSASASELVNHILEAVDRFTGRVKPADDRTVVVVRFEALETMPERLHQAARLEFAAA